MVATLVLTIGLPFAPGPSFESQAGVLPDSGDASPLTYSADAAQLRMSRLADEAGNARPAPEVPLEWSDDPVVGLTMTPPAGWTQAAPTALNPVSDPPEPTQERARFHLREGTPSLYTLPVPITSAIVRDAGAVISIALAREDTDLAAFEADPIVDAADARLAGFTVTEEESVYEDIHILARYYASKTGERRIVARVYALQEDWAAVAPVARRALATLKSDPQGANAPAPPPPPPPPAPEPEPAPAPDVVVDPTLAIRNTFLARAASWLGTPYVWGGNVAGRGMDCSAYVSAVWGVSRYTTDSIWNVSHFITKDELRAGDAMNLTIGRDPSRTGHIRLFEAWANPERTLMWVYEETPPRAVHRVIAYDSRYQPIRRNGLSSAGAALLIPAPVSAPERAAPSSGNRTSPQRTSPPTARQTPRPTVRPTVRPTAVPTRTPPPGSYLLDKSTGVVIGGARSGNSPPPMLVIQTLAPTPAPTVRPTATPKPTLRPATPRPTPRATPRRP